MSTQGDPSLTLTDGDRFRMRWPFPAAQVQKHRGGVTHEPENNELMINHTFGIPEKSQSPDLISRRSEPSDWFTDR